MIQEALEGAAMVGFAVGWRVFFAVDKVARLNPIYRATSGAVLDTLFGSVEDFESVPRTTRSP